MKISAAQRRMLHNLDSHGGTGPDRPYMNGAGRALMRLGLIELVDPPRLPGRCKGVSFAQITTAGRKALENDNG